MNLAGQPTSRPAHRAGAALLGASLMVATGVLSLEEAYQAVDFQYGRAATWHDDCRRQSPTFRIFPDHHALDRRQRQATNHIAWNGYPFLWGTLSVSGQRYNLPGRRWYLNS